MTLKTLLVIGGSGAMGQHVIQSLLESPNTFGQIRILTRDPSSNECRALEKLGSGKVVFNKGNVNDEASLRAAFAGVHSIFCNTNFWSCLQDIWTENGKVETDPWPSYRLAEELDVQQGKLILKLARELGVEHFVFSSLDAMDEPSGGLFPAPHFDAKARVAKFIGEQGQIDAWYAEHVTVLVTAPYMENFKAGRMFRGGGTRAAVRLEGAREKPRLVLRVPIGSALWPMVTLDDIGWFAAHILDHEELWRGRTLRIVSESLSLNEIGRIFQSVTGIEAVVDPYTLQEYRAINLPETPALSNMFGFIDRFGLPHDMNMLRGLNPSLITFEKWLRMSGWKGEQGIVQKENARPLSRSDEPVLKN